VVEVLEAVHLLLAGQLFVVVVALDPRWLLRSVSSTTATCSPPIPPTRAPHPGQDEAAYQDEAAHQAAGDCRLTAELTGV
jgi:hypothetical protein